MSTNIEWKNIILTARKTPDCGGSIVFNYLRFKVPSFPNLDEQFKFSPGLTVDAYTSPNNNIS